VPFSQPQPRKDDGARVATARAPSKRLSVRAMGQHNNQKGVIRAKGKDNKETTIKWYFLFLLRRRGRLSQPRKDDGHLLSASARAMGRHKSDPPKQKVTTQGKNPITKKSDPPKRKATTPDKQTSNKKKQRCDISDADLDAQLKQVSP
jgi:hypothetical protein